MIRSKKIAFLVTVSCFFMMSINNTYAYQTFVKNTTVSLNVRASPSIYSKLITTLSSGKDLVAEGNSSTQVTEGGKTRHWNTFAYPSSSVGKYTNSTRGYICKVEGMNTYIRTAHSASIASTNGGYLYKNYNLTDKYSTKYPQGKSFGPGQSQGLRHHGSNLNAWIVRPDNVLKYMNGWLSYAK